MPFDPWGPIQSVLVEENDSDLTLSVISAAGLPPDRQLEEDVQRAGHKSRVRAYLGITNRLYQQLNDKDKLRFSVNVANRLCEKAPKWGETINETLRRIGWEIIDGVLVPLDVVDPQELAHIPLAARPDLLKAAERLAEDPSGAITAACGAIDILTEAIYRANPQLGNPAERPFQERVNRSLDTLGVFDRYEHDLVDLGWDAQRARQTMGNFKGSINQIAGTMASLRSSMGDTHGTRETLGRLVFSSIKWAVIIAGLLTRD